MPNKPYVIAHRGFSGLYPENTVRSVSEAITIGADIIEFDVQLTKDNEVVVFHDAIIDRIVPSESGKKIADFTLAELKEKDFGSWLDSCFSDCKIATLAELLALKQNSSNDSFDFIIEIKGKNADELIPRVKELLDSNNFYFSQGYLSVRDKEAFEIARKYEIPLEKIGIMQKKRTPTEIINLAKQLQAKTIQIRPKNWTENDWTELQHCGLRFTIFFADTEEEYQRYVQLKPYGLFTNYSNKLLAFLKERKFDNDH